MQLAGGGADALHSAPILRGACNCQEHLCLLEESTVLASNANPPGLSPNPPAQILGLLPREEGQDEGPSPLRVGFVTYDHVIHYYNLSPGLSQPQMLLVTDLEDVFVPLVDGFMVDPEESESQISQLLETIPQLFKDTAETETILGPVIESGIDAFKSAQCPGKLVVFHTGLPTAEAPGRLKNRDDRKLLGSDKEKTLLSPASDYYTQLGQRCVEAGVGVDLFVCCDAYVDLASVGQVPFVTGGSLYKYTYFQVRHTVLLCEIGSISVVYLEFLGIRLP